MSEEDSMDHLCDTCRGGHHEASGMLRLSGSQEVYPYRSVQVRKKAGPTFVLDRFETIAKHSAYTKKQIVSVINEAVEIALKKWGWAPFGLQISVNGRRSSSMGVSFYVKPDATVRRIEVNPRLFYDYDLKSIRRLLLHELAHHRRFSQGQPYRSSLASHDSEFCRLLSMADPKVKSDRKACVYFTSDVDKDTLSKRVGDASSAVFHVRESRGRYQVKLTSDDGRASVPWSKMLMSTLESIGDLYGGKLRQVKVESGGVIPAKNMVQFLEYLAARQKPQLAKAIRAILEKDRKSSSRRTRSTTRDSVSSNKTRRRSRS